MIHNSSDRQERIDTSEHRPSPNAGWQEVYAAMGVSPTGDAEERPSTTQKESVKTDGDETDRTSRGDDVAKSASARS